MSNKEIAKWVVKAFRPLQKETSWKATCGNKKAALELMEQMTAEGFVLKKLGYTLSNTGRLVKYIPKDISLILRAMKGDSSAAMEILKQNEDGKS